MKSLKNSVRNLLTYETPFIYNRLMNQREKILIRLKQGSATNVDLNKICYRYSSRIHELRAAGSDIEKKRMSKGIYKYTLRGSKVDLLLERQKERLGEESEKEQLTLGL